MTFQGVSNCRPTGDTPFQTGVVRSSAPWSWLRLTKEECSNSRNGFSLSSSDMRSTNGPRQWHASDSRLQLLSNLPHPQLPLNQSTFTFTHTFLNTAGYSLRLPFIDTRTYGIRSRLWPSAYIKLTNNLYFLSLFFNTFSYYSFSSSSLFLPSEPFLSSFSSFSYNLNDINDVI